MIKIIILLLGLLIVSPLILKLYLHIVPGEMVGDINGWLGFLGGYLGGFMAFLSAAILFKQQKSESVRPFFVVTSSEPESTKGLLVFLTPLELGKIHDQDFLVSLSVDRQVSTAVEIKNVGVGVALDIQFTDAEGNQARYFLRDQKIFLDSHIVGTAECGEMVTYGVVHDALPKPKKSNHALTMKYTDIHGKKYYQKIAINRSINGGFDYQLHR